MLPNFIDACRNRDVFPPPLLSGPVLQNPAISRSCEQRLQNDKRSTIRANDAIDVLDDMFIALHIMIVFSKPVMHLCVFSTYQAMHERVHSR